MKTLVEGKKLQILTNLCRLYIKSGIQFSVQSCRLPKGLEFDELTLLLSKSPVVFSALNPNRVRVLNSIIKNSTFPANEFCSSSIDVALQFLNGHQKLVTNGTIGYLCVLSDEKAQEVRNITVRSRKKHLTHHLKSSEDCKLLAILEIVVTSVRGVSVSGEQKGILSVVRKRKRKKTDLGKYVDDPTYRLLIKIKNARMDNFGIKEDY